VKSCMRTPRGHEGRFSSSGVFSGPSAPAARFRPAPRCDRPRGAKQVLEQDAKANRQASHGEAALLERVPGGKISKVPPTVLRGARAPKLFAVVIPTGCYVHDESIRSRRSSSSGCPCAVGYVSFTRLPTVWLMSAANRIVPHSGSRISPSWFPEWIRGRARPPRSYRSSPSSRTSCT